MRTAIYFIGAFLVSLSVVSAGSTCALADSNKQDCGYPGVTQASCESKGCCWLPTSARTTGTPWCYFSVDSTAGYSVSSWTETETGFSGTLQLLGSGSSVYGPDLKSLKLDVFFQSDSTLRVKITDAEQARWEIPQSVIPRPEVTQRASSLKYKFTYTANPFSFEVIRLSDNQSVFKMDPTFIFKDQYIEFSTSYDAAAKTYGLGESTRLNHALNTDTTYTLWAADIGAMSFDKNLYGAYPMYLQKVNGKAHGGMLLNSNGMDVTLRSDKLTFKTIGGIVDFYVFVGESPADVVRQYTSIVGRPAIPPYWSLGFHNCKWGYESVYEVEQVVANYTAAGIPLDTQWMDIDYMQDYRDFTLDAKDFPQSEVRSFVDKLHANGQHFVPIIDPGIMIYSGYEAYDRGVKEGLFIKDIQGNNMGAKVWPGPVYFPDFLHPNTQQYWTDMLQDFYNMVPVDGIWIDMNEVSNFCNLDGKGQVCANPSAEDCGCRTVDAANPLDFPPYSIANHQDTGRLGARTLSPSSKHFNNVTMYNTHNLYGLTEQMATYNALAAIRQQQRPFVLSRSSFMSTGVHSAKWTGDNAATWDDLRSSIISILDFNLFGVPMIGADICGFNGDTNEELCARWIALGAFYPFSRDHNAINQIPQELYRWESVTEAAKYALNIRYELLPHLYTQFYKAHAFGDMVVQSLWTVFPQDPVCDTIQTQFLWGQSVMVVPVLEKGADGVNGYFPAGVWYRYNLWNEPSHANNVIQSVGGDQGFVYLSTPLGEANVYVRGGSVLATQGHALTTTAARATPFRLIVALDERGVAQGELFWDDGEQMELSSYLKLQFSATPHPAGYGGRFTCTPSSYASPETALHIDSLVLLHPQPHAVNAVYVNEKMVLLGVQSVETGSVGVKIEGNAVTLTNLRIPLGKDFKVEWK